MNQTVFVTGASGLVGWSLVKKLRHCGFRVRCLLRKNSDRSRLEPLDIEPIEGDLFDAEALRRGVAGADLVFHLAGATQAFHRDVFFRVNQLGCRHIAAAILETSSSSSAPPTLVSVSSLAAVGAARRRLKREIRETGCAPILPVDETFVPNPVSTYGKSKLAGERELLAVADRIPISVVRPAIVFGEADKLTLPLFRLVKHSPFFLIPGFRDNQFSFIYNEDLSELLLAIAERGQRLRPDSLERQASQNDMATARCSGEGIYLVSHPVNPLFSEFGQMIAQALGRRARINFHSPPGMVLATGLFQECIKKLTHHHVALDWEKALEALGGPWVCSCDKVQKAFLWKPKADLAQQVRQTADWYIENKWL